MKKIISVLLLICTLTLCLVSCGNNGSSNNEHTEHTEHDSVNGKCSVCGIDYFDILRNEVLAKGTQGEAFDEVYVDYSVNNGHVVFRAYPASEDEDYLVATYYSHPNLKSSDTFKLYMERKHVKYGEYKWYYNWAYGINGYHEKTIDGTLVASEFKETTDALEITGGANISGAELHASFAPNHVIEIIEALSTVLESCEYDISPKHFGFTYFD